MHSFLETDRYLATEHFYPSGPSYPYIVYKVVDAFVVCQCARKHDFLISRKF